MPKVKKLVHQLREKAKINHDKPCKLISDIRSTLGEDIPLPSDQALTKIIYRARQIDTVEPQSLDFEFEDKYKTLDDGEKFLLADLNIDGRFLIF